MPEIIVCQNSKNYHVVSFHSEIGIGRDSDNGITLLSQQVSRKHAKIFKEGEKYRLIDLGSTNAVWLNGEKIKAVDLVHGTTFCIADFLLTFIFDQAEPSFQLVLQNDIEIEPDQTSGPGESKTMLAVDRHQQKVSTSRSREIVEAFKLFTESIQTVHNLAEESLLQEALNSLLVLTKSEFGFIALLDRDEELTYRAIASFSPEKDSKRLHHQTIKHVITNGCAIIINKTTCTGKTFGHALCVPLVRHDITLGCCYFSRQHSPYDSLDKHINEVILQFVATLLPHHQQKKGKTLSSTPKNKGLTSRRDIILRSENMIDLYRDVHTIAPINVPALILGEAGTGKENVAEELHNSSKRQGEFVTLNCSAIPEGIFESELFGSVKGAFQDARDKPGKLELAHNGTLFLDEIGDMSLQLQPKFLRFLENQEVTRLGDTLVRKLNVRVVAATNQNLQEMIENKSFRADLFQRLSCFTLEIPPLNERKDDIEPLVHFFLDKFSQEYGWTLPNVLPNAMDMLLRHNWPGNVRELRNACLRLAVHSQGKQITTEDIIRQFEGFDTPDRKKVAAFLTLEQVEENHIQSALQEASMNISEAAKLLGVARSTMYKKMQKYGISTI